MPPLGGIPPLPGGPPLPLMPIPLPGAANGLEVELAADY